MVCAGNGSSNLYPAAAGFNRWFHRAFPGRYFHCRLVCHLQRASFLLWASIAVAFYLINLQEIKIADLAWVARDRVVGILLGLFIMWLVFDQLWGASSVVEMKRTFIANLRLLAQLAREPVSEDVRTAVERWFSLRETINTNFDKVRALRDGVVLQFGQSREQDLAFSNRIRQWQTQLRMLFITRITLWRYRMRFPGFDLPEPIWRAQLEFDHELAKTLDAMADRFEGKPAEKTGPGSKPAASI